jgi:hypothetical protein
MLRRRGILVEIQEIPFLRVGQKYYYNYMVQLILSLEQRFIKWGMQY